ncbi:MAG: Dcp1p-Dcp2p decapping enzyme complex alpha subunit [Stictis urceolatum]|nr:Dcp1p-Dcp2p decapping enzyme complex alpha subunit [Stictis urceolata]
MVKHPPPPDIPGVRAEGRLLHELRREIASLLERGENTRFPGAQPVSFGARHLSELQKQDYFVCEKSDGVRCLMYLTNDGESEVTYLIDRKNDYYWVSGLHFPLENDERAFNTNTLVDGELVNDREPNGSIQLRYLVFDCLAIAGKPMLERPLDKRLAYFRVHIYSPFSALYKKYPQEREFLPFDVQFKGMEKAYGIEMILRQTLPNLPHGSDGLIFTCVRTPYHFGTDPHILKWKPANENSIDFRLKLEFALEDPESEDEREGITEPYINYATQPTFRLLVVGDGGKALPWGEMHVDEADWQKLTELEEPLDERITECYQDEQHRWRWMRFRDDKTDPNHISTVESVIESIEDRIGERELIAVQNQIRNAWKRREAGAVGEETRIPIHTDQQKRKLDNESPTVVASNAKRRIT